jgi:diguanylate cyclase (GGDEF)-like protein
MVDEDLADGQAGVARLVVLGPAGAWIMPLGPERVTVGRDADNGIRLDGIDVSRRHCVFEPQQGGGHAVIDLGSTNGLLVNDRRVTRVALERFDRLRVGPYDLVYLDGETDAARVMDLLRPPERSTVDAQPGDAGSLRDRLLWLILMTQELRSEDDTLAVLDTLLEELLRWTRYDRVVMALLDSTDALEVERVRNVDPACLDPATLEACRPLVMAALRSGRASWGATPLGEGETLCIPLQDRSWSVSERRRSYGGQVRGGLLLGQGAAAPLPMEAEDLRLLRVLARQVATLLANVRLRRQATTDALTQLRSRACIEHALRQELEAARARGQPLAVALIDIDDFKRINDTWGHQVGDAVLTALGGRIAGTLRHDDVAGRWGGEEFLVVLPATDLAGALTAARKVVSHIAERAVGDPGVRITVSAGVAAFPVHAGDALELVRRADVALYAAKRNGKNRVEAFEDDLQTVSGERRFDVDETDATRPCGRRLAAQPSAPRLERDPRAVAWLQCDLLAPIPLKPGALTLGRSAGCDVPLPHPSVSRQHAMLRVDRSGDIVFEDYSTNGTLVNGQPITSRVQLKPGDRLTIGPFAFDVMRESEGGRLEGKTTKIAG